MSVRFDIDQRGLQRAIATYAISRGKSDADVVNKTMRYILPKASNYISAKTKGATKIRDELRSGKRSETVKAFKERTGGGDGRDTRRSNLSNTLASVIIASRERKKGRSFFPKSYGGVAKGSFVDLFYTKVQKLISARGRSAHFLRAGFIPAFRAFNLPNRGPGNQKRFKGKSRGLKAKPSLRGVAEAFATNAREGAFKLDPLAFHKAARVARRTFLTWISEDLGRQAKRSGFY